MTPQKRFFQLAMTLGFICSFAPASASHLLDYVGKDSQEATLSFSARIEVVQSTEPTMDEAEEMITDQMEFLFGPMSYGEFKAVPKGNYEIKNIVVKRKNRKVFQATYDVSLPVAIESRVGNSYEVTLPINTGLIYKQSRVGTKYPCTDDHYPSEGDFWYFWSPERLGCKLREGKHFQKIKADVKLIPNTTKTYAEFDQMADADGVVKIDMLYGMDKPDEGPWNPDSSSDVNAENYRYVARKLTAMGFSSKRLSKEAISEIAPENDSDKTPTVDVFEKEYSKTHGRNVNKIVVTMFFGASGIDEASASFHYFYKRSLEESTMMIYAGHSGLGGHLDLATIESIRGFSIQPSKEKYQIYYFNSCTSYTYYNSTYFGRKKNSDDRKGTKNLDIVTNGLATYFSAIDETNLEMVRIVDDWANGKDSLSYQEMARKMDSENLIGINGDEDNPKRVPEVQNDD